MGPWSERGPLYNGKVIPERGLQTDLVLQAVAWYAVSPPLGGSPSEGTPGGSPGVIRPEDPLRDPPQGIPPMGPPWVSPKGICSGKPPPIERFVFVVTVVVVVIWARDLGQLSRALG